MIRNLLIVLCSFVSGVVATAIVIGSEDDHAALLRHHQAQKTAHLSYDAELIADLQADPVIDVSRGQIKEFSREQVLDRFRAYFGSVEFDKWEDMQEPIIRISADGTLAAMIVRKHVALHEKGKPDEKSETVFAWISLFEKIDGKWKIFAIASTNTPE